jgi:hypothetical protein
MHSNDPPPVLHLTKVFSERLLDAGQLAFDRHADAEPLQDREHTD